MIPLPADHELFVGGWTTALMWGLCAYFVASLVIGDVLDYCLEKGWI